MSELTFKHAVMRRFINLDETHHSKSSEEDQGGSRSTTLTNPQLPRSGSRFAKDSGNHTTGCYGTNPFEPMPPVYIYCIQYDSKVQDKTKLKLKPEWVDGLPIVKGYWGLGKETAMDSHVCVRQGGGMEEELFIATCLLYLSLYKDIHPTFVWEGDKLIKGPVFLKTDSGSGRQSKSKINMQFRHDMHKLGFHIGPGLPNSTQATQEMDDLYETFQGMLDTTSQDVFTRKTYERSLAVLKLLQDRKDGIVEDNGKMIKPAQLDNGDLPEIINGKPGYTAEKCPFDFCFTFAKIFRSWMNIGFVPFTRRALSHKKVRHMLGEGGGSNARMLCMERVQANCGELKNV